MNRMISIERICAVIAVTKRVAYCLVAASLWLVAGLAYQAHAQVAPAARLPGDPASSAGASAARQALDLAQIQAQAQSAESAELADLREQLDRARHERFNDLVLGTLLLGVLGLGLGGSTAYFWTRLRRERADRDWMRANLPADPSNTLPCVETLAAPAPAFMAGPPASGLPSSDEKTMDWASMRVEEPSGFAEMLGAVSGADHQERIPTPTPQSLLPRAAAGALDDKVDLYLPLDTQALGETRASSPLRHQDISIDISLDISLDDPELGRPSSASWSLGPVKQAL